MGLISGTGRFPGGGNGNPLQYSCLENSKGGGVWWATVHGAAKRQMVDSEVAQSCPTLGDPIFATPWTVANQAPPSMRFSRQEYRSGLPFPSPEYWSGLPFPSPRDTGLPFPSPRDLPDPRIEPGSPALWADALTSKPPQPAK